MQSQIVAWGDQGDGTSRNPVLFADFSDPDVIRVGDDFYLIASDFHFMGMQVLHSTDLVNWEIIGQVYDSLRISPLYDEMQRYSRGCWAPSLRCHDGTCYIFACTPEEGLFMWHAKHPRGPWSDTICVKRVERWEDPCPFWDDNGSGCPARRHGWAYRPVNCCDGAGCGGNKHESLQACPTGQRQEA